MNKACCSRKKNMNKARNAERKE
uniref:Uncharacterized protein n=1 Tax=Arundo donax TaxID=35708 RepID=A0A0A8ZY01_ARUDO